MIGIGYVTGPLVNRAVAQAIDRGADTTLDKVNAGRDKFVPRGYQIVPEEIGQTAAFLASDLSSAINATEVLRLFSATNVNRDTDRVRYTTLFFNVARALRLLHFARGGSC